MSDLSDKRGVAVECTECRQRKSPIGRSAPLGAYLCDYECPGYYLEPIPGHLWPGESERDFGYSVPDRGTTAEAK